MIVRRVLQMCVLPLLITMVVLHGQKVLVSAEQPYAVDRTGPSQGSREVSLTTAAGRAGGTRTAQAAHDFCNTPDQAFDGANPYSTVGNSTDGVAHAGCQFDGQTYHDNWYAYQATCTGNLDVTTCEDNGGSADYDTDLVVYNGRASDGDFACPPGDADLLGCNDDNCTVGFHSFLGVPVTAGNWYTIRVGGWNDGDMGSGDLLLTCTGGGGGNPACGPGAGDCCDPNGTGTPGCDDEDCCNCICNCDPFCCDSTWDAFCAGEGFEEGCGASLPDGLCADECSECLEGGFCGDGVCDDGEDNCNCPADCAGDCPVCGDNNCDPGENTCNCPADCPGGCACTVFNNQAEFEAFNEEDGKVLKGVEDYEEGILPPGEVDGFDDPLCGGIPNLPNGFPYPNGLDNLNLCVQSNILGGAAAVPSPAGVNGLTAASAGSMGAVSDVVIANFAAHSLDLIFSGGGKTGVGFDTLAFLGGATVDMQVYSNANVLLVEASSPADAAGSNFWGVWCADGIGRINIFDPGNGAEGGDNIQMWGNFEPCECGDGKCCPSEDCDTCPNDCGLCPVCGNGVIEDGEECDPPGPDGCGGEVCLRDCTCGDLCGDGECGPGEDCENCPKDCGDCPFCGDGVVNQPGEDCDPPDDGACRGECDANCQCPGLPNDNCADRVPIFDGDTPYDTTGASTDGPVHRECQHDGQTYHDIWYNYVATCTGDLNVSTCDQADYDTDLVVYDGCDCNNLVLLGCNDDGDGCADFSSEVTVPVVKGNCYKIRVGGWMDGDFGTGTLSITCKGDGACCDHAQPGGQCTDGVSESDCLDDPNLLQPEWFPGLTCAEVEAAGLCEEHTGACCDHSQPGGSCTDDVPESECLPGGSGQTHGGRRKGEPHVAATIDRRRTASALGMHDVPAGLDLFMSPPGAGTVSHAFNSAMGGMPIPADFFAPGSDPFDGPINLEGRPLAGMAVTDTIIERLQDANFPPLDDPSADCPSEATIDIEIVALSLVSSNPITVTFNGGQDPEPWDVYVCLSDVPQPLGSMTIRHECPDGGTFDSELPILPKLIFTPAGSGPDTCINEVPGNPANRCFDAGLHDLPLDILVGTDVGWVHNPDPAFDVVTVRPGLQVDGNCDGKLETLDVGTGPFVPGINPSPCDCETPRGGSGQLKELTDEESQLAAHGILPSQDHDIQIEWFKGLTCAEIECLEHTGACCNGDTGECEDNVRESDCPTEDGVFRWEKDTMCEDLDPSCEAPIGACCDQGNTGECIDDVTESQCPFERWEQDTLCENLVPPCDICDPNCVRDVDGDGQIGAFDLANLLGCWGPFPPGSVCQCFDKDGDEEIRAIDLASLLGSWGPCPCTEDKDCPEGEVCQDGQCGPDAEACEVEFINETRNGDRVVSAKDEDLGLPGGIKKLDVKVVTPETATATLKIKRTAGSSGSAIFQSTGNDTRTVTGTQTVTIVGRNISDQPRNMEIEAKIGNDICGNWVFTVFRVDPTAFVTGDVDDSLPKSVLANAGAGPETLVHLYKSFTTTDDANDNLGHVHIMDVRAWGGIVIQGKIVPSGMNRNDFNLKHTRTESFNWDRRFTGRFYDKDGCLNSNTPADFQAGDDLLDDQSDNDEDLLPDADGVKGELFIWVIDTPKNLPSTVPANGDVSRIRYNFVEKGKYAGVKASRDVPWYWRSSAENPAGGDTFVQNNDHAGDNEVKADDTTPLTADLGASTTPNFTVTASTPATAQQGQNGAAGTVTGTMLNGGAPCLPLVYLVREVFGETSATFTVIALNNPVAIPATITGTYDIPGGAPLGAYLVKVFIKDKAKTSPNTTTITGP